MYLLTRNEKTFTCPNDSIMPLAQMQSGFKSKVYDIDTAIKCLESLGFEVSAQEDKPVIGIPESPDWYDSNHRDLYYKLMQKENPTDEEERFCTRMYHLEEGAAGLL